MSATVIQQLYTDAAGNRIFIKRDDLLPFSFGGNKVRIAQEFFSHMQQLGKDCIIGYGNARSNLSRAIANMAAAKGIPCHIISPADDDGSRVETANSHIVSSCGAVFHTCQKSQVAQTVDRVMALCQAQGLSPYYIYGDRFGKGNEATPVSAYAKVYGEIMSQETHDFDYIFLPTGTGMTHAGLLAGQAARGGKEQIIGISVARKKDVEMPVLSNYVNCYCEKNSIAPVPAERLYVIDDYLCGGYGNYDERISETIFRILRTCGIPLDPTYTGKAFWGMEEYLHHHHISGKNILFLHTGGTPLFFDFMASTPVVPCTDKTKILAFLQKIDNQLPVPLTQRVDLSAFADKILTNGHVLGIETSGQLVSAAMFYCNDQLTKSAYLTLIGTLDGYEGHGYGGRILDAAEKFCARAGMSHLHLDTEITNRRAVLFYEKHGYTISDTAQKLHMAKELSI